MNTDVRVGDTFRDTYADTQLTFTITGRGRVFEGDDDTEGREVFIGVADYFGADEVEAVVTRDAIMRHREFDARYANQG